MAKKKSERSPKEIPLSSLLLDGDNPRIIGGEKELDCMLQLYNLNPVRFRLLMNSISKKGFLVGENIIVTPHPTRKRKFIVKEGNRRVSALKMLHGESSWMESDRVPRHLKKLAKEFPASVHEETMSIPCIVITDAARLRDEIAVRHLSEEAGREDWPSVRKAQSLRDMKGVTPLELDLLERYFQFHEGTERTWALSFPLTVLKDFLKHMATHLGYASAEQMVNVYPDPATQTEVDKMLEILYNRENYEDVRKLENRRDDNLAAEILSKYLMKPTSPLSIEYRPSPPIRRLNEGAITSSSESGQTTNIPIVTPTVRVSGVRQQRNRIRVKEPIAILIDEIVALSTSCANLKLHTLAKENAWLIKNGKASFHVAQILTLRTLLDSSLQTLCRQCGESLSGKPEFWTMGKYLTLVLDKKLLSNQKDAVLLGRLNDKTIDTLNIFVHGEFFVPSEDTILNLYGNVLPVVKFILEEVLRRKAPKKAGDDKREQSGDAATAPSIPAPGELGEHCKEDQS